MSEIADFLRARYQEAIDRQHRIFASTWEPGVACPVCGRPTEVMSTYGGSPGPYPLASFEPCQHEIHDPAILRQFEEPAPDPDVVADLDAKLAIMNLMDETLKYAKGDTEVDHYGALDAAEQALRLLAQPFAGHPDHKGGEWAP
jgi:hypothetical protein